MIVPLKRWVQRLKYILLFVALTYALYHVFDAVGAWIEPDKYREPGGRALKVFQQEDGENDTDETMYDRLRLFYWYGE